MKYIVVSKFLMIALIFGSCATSKVTKSVTQEVAFINKTTVLTNPQIADLRIEERKIEGAVEVRKKDYSNPIEDAKALAIRQATLEGKCDLVAQPNFEITDSRESVSVRVVGFAAHYKNFRPMVTADTSAFVMYEKIRATSQADGSLFGLNNVATNKQNTADGEKTHSAGMIVLTVLGSILGIMTLIGLIGLALDN
jgi:hypothetical protein